MKNSISANSGQLNPELLIFVFSFLQLCICGEKKKRKTNKWFIQDTHAITAKKNQSWSAPSVPPNHIPAWQAIRPDFKDEIELHKWGIWIRRCSFCHIFLNKEVNKHTLSLWGAAIYIGENVQAFPPSAFKYSSKECFF